MSKNKAENPRPPQSLNKESLEIITKNDSILSEQQGISFSGDDFYSWFETKDGKYLVNLEVLAEAFGKTVPNCVKIIARHARMFKGVHFEFIDITSKPSENGPNGKRGHGVTTKSHYLTRKGCLRFINFLDYTRYDEERQEFIFKFQEWLTNTGDDMLDGKYIHVDDLPEVFNPAHLKTNKREIAQDNGFRLALFKKMCNELHPNSPNTYNRKIALAHNDQRLIQGPDVPFKQGWFKTLSGDQLVQHSAQRQVSTAAIICRNIDIDDINKFESYVFEGIDAKYVPPYLPKLIETTTQMTLLESSYDTHQEGDHDN